MNLKYGLAGHFLPDAKYLILSSQDVGSGVGLLRRMTCKVRNSGSGDWWVEGGEIRSQSPRIHAKEHLVLVSCRVEGFKDTARASRG